MKRKGFTLIELLAVIVILAIIALIAIPIVLNIINSANESSKIRSKELYLKAVDEAIARKNLTSNFNPSKCTVNKNGNITCDDIELVIEVKGEKPCKGTITYENGKRLSEDVAYCSNSLVGESKPNAPELMGSLTPVIYDEETRKWEVVDKTDSNWYNYNEQKWANAVIVKEGVSKDVGTLLAVPNGSNDFGSSDILAMFVWIPRYEYKIDTTDGQFGKGSTNIKLPGEIEVNFISKNIIYEETNENGYRIHPAFNFGGEELAGIWVGKFETSHTSGTYTLTCTDETCADANNIRILPNVPSLRNNKVSKFFFVSRSMSKDDNIFRIDKSKTDTHMMKNSEWGAVAYLSQSKYGKYGNEDYQGANKVVYLNNANNYITGRSTGSPTVNNTSNTGSYLYNEKINGTGASTTGTIYGVYDMSGGAWEYVMGYLSTAKGEGLPWGSALSNDSAGFKDAPNSKYFDEYTTTDSKDEKYIGHALGETEKWYSNLAYFASSSKPWFIRGGFSSLTNETGLFHYNYDSGGSTSSCSFRIVLAPTT